MINSIRKFCFMIALLETTAVLQITLFCSMSFHYKAADKKRSIPLRTTASVDSASSPMSTWGSSGTPVSPHVPRVCTLGEVGVQLFQSERVRVMGRVMASSPGLGSTCALSCRGRLGLPWSLNWNKQVRKGLSCFY